MMTVIFAAPLPFFRIFSDRLRIVRYATVIDAITYFQYPDFVLET
jgi:hypothetical protein